MSGPRPRRIGLPALAALALLAAPDAAPAQPRAPFAEQTHVLRRILFDQGYQPLKSLAEAADRPQDTVLIVLGDLRPLADADLRGLRRFLEAGGAALIASDRTSLPQAVHTALRDVTGVSLPDFRPGVEALVENPEPERCYRGFSDCPIVQPVPQQKPELFSRSVATNRPAWLPVTGRLRLQPLAVFPPGSALHIDAERVRNRPNERWLFAVGGDVGPGPKPPGRILLMADHSVFINEMMIPDDNENVYFTQDALLWLGGGTRTRALVIEDGRVNSTFEVPLKQRGPRLPENLGEWMEMLPDVLAEVQRKPEFQRELVGKADAKFGEWQKEDVFNEGILEGLRHGRLSPGDVAAVAWVALALAVLLYGCARLLGPARYRPEAGLPTLGDALADHAEAARRGRTDRARP
jgi:hypothetical protein